MKFPITYAKEFRRVRNEITKATKRAKKWHYREQLKSDQCNQKKSWNVIEGILGQDTMGSSITDLNINVETCTDSLIMADHSNSYFANIGRNLSSSFEDTTEYLAYLTNELCVNFSFVPVSLSDLEIMLKQLSNASPGHDDIPL